jgi:hypothetical protein
MRYNAVSMPDIFSSEIKPAISKEHAPPDPLPPTQHLPHEKVTAFSTFARFPQGIRFQNQEQGEDVHLFLRRHIITNVPWLLTTVALCLLPVLLIILSPLFSDFPLRIPVTYSLYILLFYYLIVFGYILVNFSTWFNHVGIITNFRVVDIDVTHIGSKNVASTNIVDIVDVEYSQSGFLSNFFNYGNVHLQTEGLKANFEFNHIPNPAKAADVVSDLMAGRKTDE